MNSSALHRLVHSAIDQLSLTIMLQHLASSSFSIDPYKWDFITYYALKINENPVNY